MQEIDKTFWRELWNGKFGKDYFFFYIDFKFLEIFIKMTYILLKMSNSTIRLIMKTSLRSGLKVPSLR